MTNTDHTQNIRRDRGGDAASPIDFALTLERDLVIFVPLTADAEEHSLEAFSAAMQWGAGYVAEYLQAAILVHDLFAEGFRLSLDGREIVPARRAC